MNDQNSTKRYAFCPSCGAEAIAAASFCGDCGGSLLAERETPALSESIPAPTRRDEAQQKVTSVQTIPPAITQASNQKRGFKGWFWRFAKVYSLLCVTVLVVAVIGVGQTAHLQNGAWEFWNGVALWSVVLLVGFWIAVWFFSFLFAFHQNTKLAVTPIPSLQVIERELVLAGYTPSLQEVLLVEQRLKSERNTAVAVSAGLIVATYAGARISKGKPIL